MNIKHLGKIPIPPGRMSSPVSIALKGLKVGEAIEVDLDQSRVWSYSKPLNIKIKTRKAGNGVTRVWRVG